MRMKPDEFMVKPVKKRLKKRAFIMKALFFLMRAQL